MNKLNMVVYISAWVIIAMTFMLEIYMFYLLMTGGYTSPLCLD